MRLNTVATMSGIGMKGHMLVYLAVILFVSRLGASSQLKWMCTSPCQHIRDVPGDECIVPCVITPDCQDRNTKSVNQSPAGPVWVDMESSPRIGSDDKTYLDITPVWRASTERIGLLTGFEVKVLCNQSPCTSQGPCNTISFNRTLTAADQTNFSMSCLFGNFSQPGMQYSTIIRSLPKNNEDSNKRVTRNYLPTCKQEPDVSLCKTGSPMEWEPEWTPDLSLANNGSVKVSFWPDPIYTQYHIMLMEIIDDPLSVNIPLMFSKYIDVVNSAPSVYFNDIPEGTYDALISINETICADCSLFRSKNNITVKAKPTAGPTTKKTVTKPSPAETSSADDTKLPVSILSATLGGIVGIVLIFVILATFKRKLGSQKSSSSHEKGDQSDAATAAMLHPNGPYDDNDSIKGTGIYTINPFHSLSPSIMDQYGSDITSGITNPSMIPQNTHTDWKNAGGRLLIESDRYADMIGSDKGDSISTVADVHSSLNRVGAPKLDLSMMRVNRCDSGIDSACSDDGHTFFSLTMTEIGEDDYGEEV